MQVGFPCESLGASLVHDVTNTLDHVVKTLGPTNYEAHKANLSKGSEMTAALHESLKGAVKPEMKSPSMPMVKVKKEVTTPRPKSSKKKRSTLELDYDDLPVSISAWFSRTDVQPVEYEHERAKEHQLYPEFKKFLETHPQPVEWLESHGPLADFAHWISFVNKKMELQDCFVCILALVLDNSSPSR